MDDIQTEAQQREAWRVLVVQRTLGRCANCKSDDRVRPWLILSLAQGGRYTPDNGISLCRTCRMASCIRQEVDSTEKSPTSFHLPLAFAGRIERSFHLPSGHKTKASLLRYLVDQFLEAPDSFEDLEEFIPELKGKVTVKWSVWFGSDQYKQFISVLAETLGISISSALLGLLGFYDVKVVPLLVGNSLV